MGEDKLTHAERIRLESLSQAVHMAGHLYTQRPTQEKLFKDAEVIEEWLLNANARH